MPGPANPVASMFQRFMKPATPPAPNNATPAGGPQGSQAGPGGQPPANAGNAGGLSSPFGGAPNPGGGATGAPNGGGGAPANGGPAGGAPAGGSPMDAFTQLWQTPADSQGNASTNPLDAFNFDPSKVIEGSRKLNFGAGVSQEQVTKALGGDAGSLMQLINTVAQNAFAQSVQFNAGMMRHGVEGFGADLERRLPDMFRQYSTEAQLNSNPLAQHPATQPLLKALSTQFTAQYPMASAQEIQQYVQEYFNGIVSMIKQPDAEQTPTGPVEINWEQLANGSGQ